MTGLYQCESCPFSSDNPLESIAHEHAEGHETRARFGGIDDG